MTRITQASKLATLLHGLPISHPNQEFVCLVSSARSFVYESVPGSCEDLHSLLVALCWLLLLSSLPSHIGQADVQSSLQYVVISTAELMCKQLSHSALLNTKGPRSGRPNGVRNSAPRAMIRRGLLVSRNSMEGHRDHSVSPISL